MNRDPFLRFTLIALSVGGLLALVEAAHRYGWPAAAAAGVIGVLLATVLAEDYTATPPPAEPPAPRERPATDGDGKPRGFTRIGRG